MGDVAAGSFDDVIFLDAVDFGGAPGAAVLLDSKSLQARYPQVSTHRISLGVLARWTESTGATRAWLLGVQPQSLRDEPRLSPVVCSTLYALLALLLQANAQGAPR